MLIINGNLFLTIYADDLIFFLIYVHPLIY